MKVVRIEITVEHIGGGGSLLTEYSSSNSYTPVE